MYRINKDERDESLPFLAFQRNVFNAIFLKYSKEGRLSSSYVGIRNIPSDVCDDDKNHHQVQYEQWHIQNPVKHLRLTVVVNWLHKNTPSYIFGGVLNATQLKNKAGVRCPKITLDAAS